MPNPIEIHKTTNHSFVIIFKTPSVSCTTMKTAIICHFFHPTHWEELSETIKNFKSHDPDLFITVSGQNAEANARIAYRDFPLAKISIVENRGFDVGPFIKTISELNLDNYDFIVKLHTKRSRFGIVNYLPMFGGQWRRKLLSFCNTRERVNKLFNILAENQSVGMIGNGELIIYDENPNKPFIGGTMFIARTQIFKNLSEKIRFSDFETTARNQTSSLAHIWERKLGHLVTEHSMTIKGYPEVSWLFRATFNFRKYCYKLLSLISNAIKSRTARPNI